MGRRKDRIAREDYSSDSGGSDDGYEENGNYENGEYESFTMPSRRKKRRHLKRSKEDEALGIFGEGSSDDDRELMRKDLRYKEVNFVEPEDNGKLGEMEEDGREDKGDRQFHDQQESLHDQEGYGEAEEAYEEEDYRPQLSLGGGRRSQRGFTLGFRQGQQENQPPTSNEEDETSYRPSFGSYGSNSLPPESRSFSAHTEVQFDTMDTTLPSAPKPSFLAARKSAPTPQSRKYGLGASLLAKMGYEQGKGLGSEGQGILNPIETKLRPERMGLGGVREMTQQARDEARRRGQVVSDDEDKPRSRRKQQPGSGTSTPRSKGKKVVYQTVEEMAGGMVVPPSIVKLVDLQGKEVELNSVLTPKREDDMRVAQLAMRDVKRFGDEFKALQQQREYVELEKTRLKEDLEAQEQKFAKGRELLNAIENISKSISDEGREALSALNDSILRLQETVTLDDLVAFNVDEAIVSILQPLLKQIMVDWDPLTEASPEGLVTFLKSWKKVLRIHSQHEQEEIIEAESGLFHSHKKLSSFKTKRLIYRSTPYESLIYHVLLPKVRSRINNHWTPYDPQPVITFMEMWEPLLPGFINNLLLEQVVIPKLRSAIDHWNPRRTRDNVHLWIFPWLPFLGPHMDDLIRSVQHKFKIVLEHWKIEDGLISGLDEWKGLFGKGVLEDLLLQYILPELSRELRENFIIDPSDQDPEVLYRVMAWRKYFRASTWGQLLESEFFSKWLTTLYYWLTSENVDLEEVGQWYEWWKHDGLEKDVLEMDGVRRGFKVGLDLMSKAADYVDQGIPLSKLPAPVIGPQRPTSKPVRKVPKEPPKPKVREIRETTFREVLEEFCAEKNLLYIPLRTTDPTTGKALFRITASADGKGGVTGYLGEGDVLYLQTTRQGPYEPVSIDKVVVLAERR